MFKNIFWFWEREFPNSRFLPDLESPTPRDKEFPNSLFSLWDLGKFRFLPDLESPAPGTRSFQLLVGFTDLESPAPGEKEFPTPFGFHGLGKSGSRGRGVSNSFWVSRTWKVRVPGKRSFTTPCGFHGLRKVRVPGSPCTCRSWETPTPGSWIQF